ncbi:MAG TPA: ribonuclease P protein component [Clostridia bacterium]|nr:ribonuclease P protein component [Clostridia bacterium]
MKKGERLKNNNDFKKIYNKGKSYVHPLAVLYVLENSLGKNRVGFSVSKRLGNAVQRNRIKRILREVFRHKKDDLKIGYDFILIARPRIKNASYLQIDKAVLGLLNKAKLFEDKRGNS